MASSRDVLNAFRLHVRRLVGAGDDAGALRAWEGLTELEAFEAQRSASGADAP